MEETNSHDLLAGLLFGLVLGIFGGVVGCTLYNEEHPTIVHESDGSGVHEFGPSDEPLQALSPPGFYNARGYDILFGRAAVDPNYSNRSRGYVPVFVRNAPNDKPFRIACQLLDQHGALQGGGSGVVANSTGGQLSLYLSSAYPGRLSCQVREVRP